MRLIENENPKKIVADEGKKIREKQDVYIEAYIDSNGNTIEAHEPYYTTLIFVPNNFTEEQMNELYIEE